MNFLRSYLSPLSLQSVRSGTGWRQDLAILSPESSRDSTFQLQVRELLPGHLRPVILKPVGRIFEISDSKPIRGKRGKCGKSLSPLKNKGLRRFRSAKTQKTQKMRTRKRGKCGKCGWLALMWLALGDPHYFPNNYYENCSRNTHAWNSLRALRLVRRLSETPTSTTSQKSIAIHLQFVLQYASNLYCSAFDAPELWGKGNTSVRLPFVSQYASHLYRNTFGKSWWLWSPGCSPIGSFHSGQFCMVLNQESQIESWPWCLWKVSRYTSHFYCETFAKVCPPADRKQHIHQIVSRYASHLYRDAFAEVLGSGVVGAPPI